MCRCMVLNVAASTYVVEYDVASPSPSTHRKYVSSEVALVKTTGNIHKQKRGQVRNKHSKLL